MAGTRSASCGSRQRCRRYQAANSVLPQVGNLVDDVNGPGSGGFAIRPSRSPRVARGYYSLAGGDAMHDAADDDTRAEVLVTSITSIVIPTRHMVSGAVQLPYPHTHALSCSRLSGSPNRSRRLPPGPVATWSLNTDVVSIVVGIAAGPENPCSASGREAAC